MACLQAQAICRLCKTSRMLGMTDLACRTPLALAKLPLMAAWGLTGLMALQVLTRARDDQTCMQDHTCIGRSSHGGCMGAPQA